MILFGTTNVIPYLDDGYIIYNLSSYTEQYERIHLLPSDDIGKYYNDEKTFDLLYANSILQDDFYFMELMKIMIPIYEGKDVLLLISERFENITESLMKFISGRYGIISYIVNEAEDLEYLNESNFTINGLYNLDIDKNRFSRIYAISNMKDGEVEYNGFE